MRKTLRFASVLALAGLPLMAMAQFSVPYSTTLGNESLDPNWTVIDNNNDEVTWHPASNHVNDHFAYEGIYGAFSGWSYQQDMDDWLISPAINLKEGVTYVVKFDVQEDRNSWMNLADDWEFYMATQPTVLDLVSTKPLIEEKNYYYGDDNYSYETKILKVTPTVTGDYYFAFHVSTKSDGEPTSGGGGIAVRDFSIVREDESGHELTGTGLLNVASPGASVAAGQCYAKGNPEELTGLGRIELSVLGDGDISLGDGFIVLYWGSKEIKRWSAESEDLKLDAENATLVLTGVTGQMVVEVSDYVLYVPARFVTRGDYYNNEFRYTFYATGHDNCDVAVKVKVNNAGYPVAVVVSADLGEDVSCVGTVLNTFHIVASRNGEEVANWTRYQAFAQRGEITISLAEPCTTPGNYSFCLKPFSTAWAKASTNADDNWYYYNTEEVTTTFEVSSVGLVGAEGAEAEYFTLDGVKVSQPQQGLYLERRGGEVRKVIVK